MIHRSKYRSFETSKLCSIGQSIEVSKRRNFVRSVEVSVFRNVETLFDGSKYGSFETSALRPIVRSIGASKRRNVDRSVEVSEYRNIVTLFGLLGPPPPPYLHLSSPYSLNSASPLVPLRLVLSFTFNCTDVPLEYGRRETASVEVCML